VPGADLRVGSVAELPFANATFDLVACMDVVEHVPEPVRAPMFGEVRRVLKPGGRFVLQTPHAGTFQALDAQYPRHRFPALYRRVVRRGVRDQAYDGRQDAVWHGHFTRDELLRLAGTHWRVDRFRYPGLLVWPLADLSVWPFHRSGRTDHALARSLRTRSRLGCEARLRPERGYEILLMLSRERGGRARARRASYSRTPETYVG
jgi:SAM-dependent methyltransferase